MVYELKEWNNKYSNNNDIRKIMETAAIGFAGSRPHNLFVEVECASAFISNETRQHLYLVDGDKVIASVAVCLRDGMATDSINLLLAYVNTHPDYRKEGIMSQLINHLIKFYEVGDLTHDTWHVDDETLEGASAFKSTFFPTQKRSKAFWSLYSIVSTYYARFGFVPFELTSMDKVFQFEEIGIQEFNILENERVLSFDEDCHLLTDSEYLPNEKFTELDRNVSFKRIGLPDMMFRVQKYFELYHEKYSEEIGYEVKSDSGITRIFLMPDIAISDIWVHRLYSDVKNKESLKLHLKRISKYLQHKYAKWYVNSPIFLSDKTSLKLQISEGDVVIKGHGINFNDIKDWLVENGWSLPKEDAILPMCKDFGARGVQKGTKWPYNGFWAFD